MMRKWRGPVPFYSFGDLYVSAPYRHEISSGAVAWRDWYSFTARLTIMRVTTRGRDRQHIQLSDGRVKYAIFLADFVDAIKRCAVQPDGSLFGRWGFCKRVASYGLYLLSESETT